MRFYWIYLFCFYSIASCAKGQCNARNNNAATQSGRRCRRQCVPRSSVPRKRCKASSVCTCDHECGYSCIPREALCLLPPEVENAIETKIRRRSSNGSFELVSGDSFKYDDVAEYVCKPGYKRDFPIMQHLCHSRSGWTGTTVCILSCQRYSFSGVIQNNMRCGKSCKVDDDCKGILKCRCDGFCSRSCVNPNVNCGNAPAATNVDLTYTGSGIEREAHYRCREGFYHESGSTVRRCTGGGTWDGQAVSCQSITCGDPRPSIQATGGDVANWRRGPYRVGQSFTFRCPRTHEMLGSRVRTCLSTGRWSGLLTVCDDRGERVRCRHPGVPINGRITSTNNLEIGSFVEFECNPGYSMYGDGRQECLYFLQWSDDRAPKCINPRYPFDGENVVGKLLQAAEDPFIGKSISGTTSSNIEAYFVIDISDDVRDDALSNSLKFAEERMRNMSRNGRIRCEISAFASERVVLLDLQTTTTEEAINNLNNARANRLNILEEIDTRRNTHRAIEILNLTLSSSFSEDPDKTRYVFLFANGPHAQGDPPNVAMDNIRSIYEGYLLEIYVIAFGEEFQNDQALTELQSLAPKGNFLPNPPLDLFVTSQSGASETDYNDCGRAGDVGKIKNRVAVGKVIGGSFAIDGAWPWQAAFAYRRQSVYSTYNSPIGIFGGGSLINNGWVITAAHIFAVAKRIPNWPQSFILTLGTTRLLSNRSSDLSPHTRAFLPERVITHENYVEGTYDYDIALVKLGQEQEQFGDIWLPSERSGRVEYSKRIQRVCLPCTENNCVGKYLRKIGKLNGNEGKEESCRIEGEWLLEEGDNEVIEEKNILTAVTGFGYTDESEPVTSNHLKQGLIRLRNRDRCSQDRDLMTRHRPPLPEKVAFTERMTCGIGGGLNSVVDSCTGDSGGPLVREIIDEETGENCWVLVGLVSWGLNCATSYTENNTKKYFPGFYAKTTPFAQWIAQNIDEELDEECQERNPANLPPGRKCKKRCQTKTDCGRSSKECICDDVCGMSCINPDLRCDNSETFENGVIAGSLIYKSTITYTCNRGYVLVGSNQRTCRSDKKFTGEAPTCRQQRCLVPRAPRFGTISTNERFVLFGESITFTCNPQYEIVGRSSRSLTVACGENGDWSDEIPTCREIRCRVPDPPEFGSVSTQEQWVLVGEIITYSCNTGYEMVSQASGRLTVACLRNGEWSNDTPQCREQRCLVPRAPRFGTISSNERFVLFGESITFTCNSQYEIVGRSSRSLTVQCGGNGDWSDETPTCREIRCKAPQPPEFGSVSPQKESFLLGEAVTYSCNSVYEMVNQPSGRLIVTCLRSKQWSNGVPQCRAIRCIVPKPPAFGSVSSRASSLPVGRAITYSCNRGYEMVDQPSMTLTVRCLANKQWSKTTPQCRESRCEVIRPSQFGTVSTSKAFVPLGASVTYRCRDGYGMAATSAKSFRITCQRRNGVTLWSTTEIPECIDYNTCGVAGDTASRKNNSVRARRAIGGTNATLGAWPWHALISRRSVNVLQVYGKDDGIYGGGSVVNTAWILTVAHLFHSEDMSDHLWKKNFLVTLGIGELPARPTDRLPFFVQVFQTADIIIHESYDAETFDYDIALIRVGQPYRQQRTEFVPIVDGHHIIQFSGYVRPICLPCMEDTCINEYLKRNGLIGGNLSEETKCRIEGNILNPNEARSRLPATAIGFGSTEPQEFVSFNPKIKLPKNLQQVALNIQDDQYCRNFSDEHIDWKGRPPIPYTDRMLCASNTGSEPGSIDTCQGDSGSPLMRKIVIQSGRSCWIQIGLISWGVGCAQTAVVKGVETSIPSYFANLLDLIPWVKRNIQLRCVVPKPPQFGSVSIASDFADVGSSLVYSCNDGYGIEGQSVSTCLDNATWSSAPPVCKDFSKCGQAGDVGNIGSRARVRRATGGEDAKRGAWPWQVLISVTRGTDIFSTYRQSTVRGGGSIINNKWILSASQMFEHISNQQNPRWFMDFRLTLGLHRRPTKPSDVLPSTVQVYAIERVIGHTQYSARTFDYDVALIKVGQRFSGTTGRWLPIGPASDVTIQFTNFVRPICLPCMSNSCIEAELKREGILSGRETDAERCRIEKTFLLRGSGSNNASAVVTGFGYTKPRSEQTFSERQLPQHLQQLFLQVRDDLHCITVLNTVLDGRSQENAISYTPRMLCSDSSRNKIPGSSCQGDSGGPLAREVVNEATGERCWVQIGIVSWGRDGCAQTVLAKGKEIQLPGFYANVIELMPWIKAMMADN